MKSPRLIYLAHPLRGDIPGNLDRVYRWLEWAWHSPQARRGAAGFVADWVLAVQAQGEDHGPLSRELGLAFDAALIEHCDELWLVGGRVTDGMARERLVALAEMIPVRDLTHLGPEPPTTYEAIA